MNPEIDFQHVLNELSVNRFDPCEVVRELVSNSYDAKARNMRLAAVSEEAGFIFSDDGTGLGRTDEVNGITPYAAFFSIGKSTKKRGDGGIGYKCQGSKLCFAANRFLIITRTATDNQWWVKVVDNPRQTLAPSFDITPTATSTPWKAVDEFFSGVTASTQQVVSTFNEDYFTKQLKTGTLVAVRGFDAENFARHFLATSPAEGSYIYNYVRHCTRHGDTRLIAVEQGFKKNQILQLTPASSSKTTFALWTQDGYVDVPGGFPYLPIDAGDLDIRGPSEIARLRDGRFYTRSAKKLTFSGKTYSLILAVDGNRRAHDGYRHLDRKGAAKSGIRLSDQRGTWISSGGIKAARYNELFGRAELQDYSVLADGDGQSHYHLVIDGDFELVTNRNGLSRSAYAILEHTGFVSEVRAFLENVQQNERVFKDLLSRLRREQSESRLNEQIELLDESKEGMKRRERFEIGDRLYVSPQPGEEYLAGVLYAELGGRVDPASPHAGYWKRILTFSTQGIDSIATNAGRSLKVADLVAVEYKYVFSNSGPFNHALSLVDYIVAWKVELNGTQVKDQYGCFGDVALVSEGIWEISNICHVNGDTYDTHKVAVVCLRTLIGLTFNTKFITPPQAP
jgi:hypothetical protein